MQEYKIELGKIWVFMYVVNRLEIKRFACLLVDILSAHCVGLAKAVRMPEGNI
jgi:hypothetical protein